MAGDLSQDPAVLLAEILELQAQINVRQAALARLAARAGQAPAWSPADDLIDIEELTYRLGRVPRTAKEAERRTAVETLRSYVHKRPAWRWLRDLGQRHAVGGALRWRWDEVEAAKKERSTT